MPLSLPGAIVAAAVNATTGVLTITGATGDVIPVGTVPPGTQAWPDEYGRLILEAPNGEQTRVGTLGLPVDPVYRGGGSVNGAPLGGTPAVVVGRRWAATITTDATGAATITPPAGLFGSVWSVSASTVGSGFTVVTSATATAIGLQVWTGTAVLLGGQTLAKPSSAVTVLLEVSGSSSS